MLEKMQNEMWMSKKKKDKKGFTLVEVIVVLVILAILAAILIPSMIGWIQKAQNKSAIVEGKADLLAAQTVVSENYKAYTGTGAATALTATDITAALKLADVGSKSIDSSTVDNGKVTAITITSSDGVTCAYTRASGWTTTK